MLCNLCSVLFAFSMRVEKILHYFSFHLLFTVIMLNHIQYIIVKANMLTLWCILVLMMMFFHCFCNTAMEKNEPCKAFYHLFILNKSFIHFNMVQCCSTELCKLKGISTCRKNNCYYRSWGMKTDEEFHLCCIAARSFTILKI